MKQEEILNCILDPDRLKEISFDRLKQALTDYPYSQNLHFLLAQKSMQEQHPDFERHLKTAATYMNSRSFLRKQLQQNDRPSQPIVEPEPEVEPAQGNSTIIIAPEILMANIADEDLPTVEFIPDLPIDEDTPNHVADIATDTPPADQPPPNETSVRVEHIERIPPIPSIVSAITPPANQVEDPEIAPVEKKIPIQHEPIIDQPRIIDEQIIFETETEEPTVTATNITDLIDDGIDEIPGTDLEMDDEVIEISVPISPNEELEIVAFPEQFDFDDEMDDLLNKPLIEVIPETFAKSAKEVEQEDENEISDLLLEDFDEVLTEDLDTEEELTLQPKLGKWIKKYQASDKKGKESGKKRSKKKNETEEPKKKVKSQKAKKKAKKKEVTLKTNTKEKKTEKLVKKKAADSKQAKKKKKKTSEEKISKKKAIRKFANRSIVEDGETISMTLADLYVKQGKIEKAIVAYERLSLIIPEKKAFFASLIKKLKKK